MNNDFERNITDFEKLFLQNFKQYFPALSNIITTNKNGCLEITIQSYKTENDIGIWIEGNEIGVEIGKWTHTHFTEINDALLFIKDILDDFIVVWKVTKQDGHLYSGHYDIRLWQENVDKKDWNYNLIDEPDSLLESNSKVERSTFNRIIENN